MSLSMPYRVLLPLAFFTLFLSNCRKEMMIGTGTDAPSLGEALSPITTFDGKAVKLSELYPNGPVMLVFLRSFS